LTDNDDISSKNKNGSGGGSSEFSSIKIGDESKG
jgi:hypothetical protein